MTSIVLTVDGKVVFTNAQAPVAAPVPRAPGARTVIGDVMTLPFLEKGAVGQDVKRLQRALKDLGLFKRADDTGRAVDGVFGDATHSSVVAFQRDFLAGRTPDGKVGSRTRLALKEALAANAERRTGCVDVEETDNDEYNGEDSDENG